MDEVRMDEDDLRDDHNNTEDVDDDHQHSQHGDYVDADDEHCAMIHNDENGLSCSERRDGYIS